MIGFISWDTLFRCLAIAVIAYLLGSLSFSIIITKIAIKKDIRQMGSGNAGMTNVLRCVGTVPAILTFVLDFAKCVLAVFIGFWIFKNVHAGTELSIYEYETYGKYLAGLFCALGHMYPIFFKFKGGKGVVTTEALAIMVDWRVGLVTLGIFIIVLLISKYVSLSSIIAAASFGFVTFFFRCYDFFWGKIGIVNELTWRYIIVSSACALGMGLLVIVEHRINIVRLKAGEEKKFLIKEKDT